MLLAWLYVAELKLNMIAHRDQHPYSNYAGFCSSLGSRTSAEIASDRMREPQNGYIPGSRAQKPPPPPPAAAAGDPIKVTFPLRFQFVDELARKQSPRVQRDVRSHARRDAHMKRRRLIGATESRPLGESTRTLLKKPETERQVSPDLPQESTDQGTESHGEFSFLGFIQESELQSSWSSEAAIVQPRDEFENDLLAAKIVRSIGPAKPVDEDESDSDERSTPLVHRRLVWSRSSNPFSLPFPPSQHVVLRCKL